MDYGFSGGKTTSGEDTATDDTGHVIDPETEGSCIRMKQSYDFLPLLGWCRLINTDGIAFSETIISATVEADPGTPFPGTAVPIHIDGDEDGVSPSNSWPGAPHFESDDIYATEASDTSWSATASSSTGDLGTLNDCAGACDWDWLVVEIYDPARSAAGTCNEYVVPELRVCLVGSSPLRLTPAATVHTQAPAEASCEAGSGEFRLVPTNTIDSPHHTSRIDLLRPIQMSGTGRLTADALLLGIDADHGLASRLRVLPGRDGYTYPTQEVLQGIPTVGEAPPTTSGLGASAVYGGTTFVLETPRGEAIGSTKVQLSWSCPARGEETSLIMQPGYTLSAGELGCFGGWKQALTLRPSALAGERRLSLEVYGMPTLSKSTPLHPSGGAEGFSFSIRGLRVDGRLLSEVAGVGAEVEIERITYRGMPVCQPGRYHAPAE